MTQIRKSKSKQEEEDIHVIGSGSHANQIQDVKPDAGCQNVILNRGCSCERKLRKRTKNKEASLKLITLANLSIKINNDNKI